MLSKNECGTSQHSEHVGILAGNQFLLSRMIDQIKKTSPSVPQHGMYKRVRVYLCVRVP